MGILHRCPERIPQLVPKDLEVSGGRPSSAPGPALLEPRLGPGGHPVEPAPLHVRHLREARFLGTKDLTQQGPQAPLPFAFDALVAQPFRR